MEQPAEGKAHGGKGTSINFKVLEVVREKKNEKENLIGSFESLTGSFAIILDAPELGELFLIYPGLREMCRTVQHTANL